MTSRGPLHTLELVGSRDLTRSVRSFDFCVTDVGQFAFEAGQYVAVDFTFDGHQHTRYFSIASPPRGDNRIEICAKRVEGAIGTRYLWAQHAGARMRLRGPFGAFTLRKPEVRNSLFVAAGTGIAPVRSMLLSLPQGLRGTEMSLLFGVREQQDLLYDSDFLELARLRSHFFYQTILSRPGNGWHGLRGHVQQHVEDVLRAGTAMDVYVSGMKGMVEEVRHILQEKGFDPGSIHFEKHS